MSATQARLAWIRQLEAIAFRSFPSTSTFYDGTWAIRLTAGHPAKRLNSVNPLDPSDTGELAVRMAKAQRRFDSFGRPLMFRLSPLAPPALTRYQGLRAHNHHFLVWAAMFRGSFEEALSTSRENCSPGI